MYCPQLTCKDVQVPRLDRNIILLPVGRASCQGSWHPRVSILPVYSRGPEAANPGATTAIGSFIHPYQYPQCFLVTLLLYLWLFRPHERKGQDARQPSREVPGHAPLNSIVRVHAFSRTGLFCTHKGPQMIPLVSPWGQVGKTSVVGSVQTLRDGRW